MSFKKTGVLTLLVTVSFLQAQVGNEADISNSETVAEAWIQAWYTSQEASMNMVKNNMAEDGKQTADRYVGFGFMYDPDADKGKMKITSIMESSPASEVLMVGDEFVSVKGVVVNERNMGKLPFRGKPGEEIKARIKRDGKIQNISVARGVIEVSYTKTEVLENISMGNSENWAVEEFNIDEVISEKNIVYVLHNYKDTDKISGLPYKAYTMTRFVFNESGKVSQIRSLSEDRFVLEQQGYTISR